MSKLRKCPFCGGEVKTFKSKAGYWGVMCNTPFCCDMFGYDTEADAIKAWNNRKPMEEVVEIIESYYEEAEHYGFVSAISDMATAIKETALE